MKRIFFCLLFICLTVTIQAQLDFRNDYYYRKRAIQESFPIQKGSIVMLGNSLTEQGSWSEYFPKQHMQNRGIGGDILAGMLDRLQPILTAKPKKMFIMAGINNILFSDITKEQFISEYKQILDQIKKGSLSTRIYIQSLIPVNEALGNNAAFLKNKNPKIKEYNDAIKALAIEYGVPYLDIYSVMEKDGELNSEYTFDGVHLNASGYQAWIGVLEKHM